MKIKNGEFWLGDCLELMKDIPDGSIDMVITDPPYKMTKTGNSSRPNYMPNGFIIGDSLPDTRIWFEEVFRVMKDSTHFYTFTNRNDLRNYLNIADEVGFHFHNIINMIKDTNMPNRWYLKYTEPVLFFKKGKAKAIHDMTSRDYQHVKMLKGIDKMHPTEKPLSFIQKLITNSSVVGDIVLDPFAGSGTTAVAAEKNNRKWICIEQNKKYYDIATNRVMEMHVHQSHNFFGE
jgi:site-specific DNA-methyltransferase (adenine-specific)